MGAMLDHFIIKSLSTISILSPWGLGGMAVMVVGYFEAITFLNFLLNFPFVPAKMLK